jgi:hypothetical protein
MIGISLTVIVCAVTAVIAAGGRETVRSCEVYNEARPITDLEPCRYRFLRDQLGRMMTSGSGIPTG